MQTDRLKVLFDTDIGTDIDDALCLSYLLAQPRCELVGITTVTGNTQERAMIADALCQAAGIDVPIFAGAQDVILEGPGQRAVPQAEALARLPHREAFPTEAIEFMRETIRKHPGEITLLGVGPMTNIALLFSIDPEIPRLLKQTVLMAGRFLTPGAEWNALVDPLAAAIVYRRMNGANISVGLDVTMQCRMAKLEAEHRLSGPLLGAVALFAEVWYRKRDTMIFHDPLAAALIFEPDLCSYEKGTVTVDVHSRIAPGTTHWTGQDGPHTIAVDVEPERFFRHFFSVHSSWEASRSA